MKIMDVNLVRMMKAEMWNAYACNDQLRIVTFRNGLPVVVVPTGEFIVPMFRLFDELALVSVGPHRFVIGAIDGVSSADGIMLVGEIAVEFRVRTSDPHLRRVAAGASTELSLFSDRVLSALQEIALRYAYSEVDRFRTVAGPQVRTAFEASHSAESSPFELIAVHTRKLDAADQAVREARLRVRQVDEEGSIQARQAHWAAESAERTARTQALSASHEIELERLRHTHEIEIDAVRQEQALALQAKRAELLKTEGGQMAENMELVMQFKAKQLEAEKLVAQLGDNQARDVLKAVLGHQSGQNSVLRAIAANQIGIKLTDDTALIEGVKQLNEQVPPKPMDPVNEG